ncbi:hypothetical protein ACIP5N_21220 [Streptomyces sp. NPDC088768]|uniref:hypothetical protein n=1 Tax=Streptomyces sp. NPDC088768 TaxID=3365894 RepID=UPI003802F605
MLIDVTRVLLAPTDTDDRPAPHRASRLRLPAQRGTLPPAPTPLLSHRALSDHGRTLAHHHPRARYRTHGPVEVVSFPGMDTSRTPEAVVVADEASRWSARYLLDRLAHDPRALAGGTVHVVLGADADTEPAHPHTGMPGAESPGAGSLDEYFTATGHPLPTEPAPSTAQVTAAALHAVLDDVLTQDSRPLLVELRRAVIGQAHTTATAPADQDLFARAMTTTGLLVGTDTTAPPSGQADEPLRVTIPLFQCPPLTVSARALSSRLLDIDGALRTCRELLGDVSTTVYGRAYLAREDLLYDAAVRERDQPTASGTRPVVLALRATTALTAHAVRSHSGTTAAVDLLCLHERTLHWAQHVTGARAVPGKDAARGHFLALATTVAGERGLNMVSA